MINHDELSAILGSTYSKNAGTEDSKYSLLIQCAHKPCKECDGTGTKKNGTVCLYMISYPCPMCNPRV